MRGNWGRWARIQGWGRHFCRRGTQPALSGLSRGVILCPGGGGVGGARLLE